MISFTISDHSSRADMWYPSRLLQFLAWARSTSDVQLDHPSLPVQGSYRSWKTWKVMEFKYFSFQAWKVMELIVGYGKAWKIIVCVVRKLLHSRQVSISKEKNKIQASYVRRYPKTRTIFESGR